MELDKENASQDENEDSKGWTILYGIVVGALAGQIVFYAWLTSVFE